MSTVRIVGRAVMVVAACLGASVLEAADGDTAELVRVEAAVDRALEYLASRQDASGSWPHGLSQQSNTGIDSLCLLAFLGRGHVPGRGPYRETVGRAVDGLLAARRPDDLLVRAGGHSHGPMYEHGLATLALIEASGWVADAEMREACQAAVDVIVKSQNREGGWRYQPKPQDADLSVTVMQVVALRAAQNARFAVPEETIEGAIRYVKSCARPEGGFAYQPGQGVKNAQSAAGALSLTLLGRYDDPAVEAALASLQKREYRPQMDDYFHYMNYYAMQAHFQAGERQWAAWNGRVRSFLLDAQATDGSWPGWGEERLNGQAKCYSTALATMALEVYMHYLPAYQR
ncbi:MAG: prenyltransferase/squalene oxidase repeat-containing protein [Planctomycetota bacterium]|nr:terpene cyclase/mutase family protein [Planctomycetota bacterium]